MARFLRLLGVLHRHGFHPAVVAGIVMMPAVVAVGVLSDAAEHRTPDPVAGQLRPSFDDFAVAPAARAS